jgi:glutamate dehydrogenase (NAD(P)+)
MMPDIDEAEVRGLARAMTLKYGFLGMALGGAKAGVRGDPEASQRERRRRLAAFGQAIAPLLSARVYTPATDMGTTDEDIRYLLRMAGVPAGGKRLPRTRSGYYTAFTVVSGAEQAARHVGLGLPGSTVAIEGWGKVGSALGGLLADVKARIVAISTSHGAIFNPQGLDVRQLLRLSAESGGRVVELYDDARRIERSALLELAVDILCPCARHNSIHAGNAGRIAARIISAGANNPVTAQAEHILFERGVLCLPDFVTNCGGVLGSALEAASARSEQITAFIEREIGPRISWLLDEADRQQTPPRYIAASLALRRSQEMQQHAARPQRRSALRRLTRARWALHRRGWLPRRLTATMMLDRLSKSLAW